MKKRLGDITIDEIARLCNRYAECDDCPMFTIGCDINSYVRKKVDCEVFIPEDPKYREFLSIEELLNEYKLRFDTPNVQPVIWVRNKSYNSEHLIVSLDYENGTLRTLNEEYKISLGVLFNEYTFLDGSPCGIKKEETN